MIAFVQPFGLYAPGGGSRILRGLLDCDHPPALSIYTGVHAPVPSQGMEEIHLSTRPSMGRLEKTRFHKRFYALDSVFESRFKIRLRKLIAERGIRAIHAIPHGFDLVPVWSVAQELGIPFFLNVHDELQYVTSGHPSMPRMVEALGSAWRGAAGVFVISEEMGKEYSARYGARPYEAITDGLTAVAESPLPRPARSLRVYFMGLFHFRYQANLRALLDALKLVRKDQPDWDISVTCRCRSIFGITEEAFPLTVLPFASEAEVAKDMLNADLLYQPLPFEEEAANFGKFSLSTKLVTYVGSGLPILYHGPADTAAARLLAGHDAAVTATTLDPQEIARLLIEAMQRRDTIVNHALRLARERFLLADQQRRFWTPIRAVLEGKAPPPRNVLQAQG